jgi:ADP-L-glycero-D-manno-heptose 6-epimerase
MILVTGAAGFIGSNLTHRLSNRDATRIFAVDNLKSARKFENIAMPKSAITWTRPISSTLRKGDSRVSFLPSCSGSVLDTTEQDGHYMMQNNFRYSVELSNTASRPFPLFTLPRKVQRQPEFSDSEP